VAKDLLQSLERVVDVGLGDAERREAEAVPGAGGPSELPSR
jgi:hypothetical protein